MQIGEPSAENTNDGHTEPDLDLRKRTRGLTRRLVYKNALKPGQKHDVVVPENLRRVVGETAAPLITEIGVIIRKFAQLKIAKFKEMTEVEKDNIWAWLKEKFRLDTQPHVRRVVFSQINSQYKSYRYRLHKNFFLCHRRAEDAAKHVPPGLEPVDWNWLCKHFSSAEFKKISSRNKENWKHLRLSHSTGTKSYSRISHDSINSSTGEKVGQIKLWYNTHFNSIKSSWVDDVSKEIYDKMIERQARSVQEDPVPMTDDEICLEVLGHKPGYVRGLGAGPKPPSRMYNRCSQTELEEARKRAKDAEKLTENLSEQVEGLKASQANMLAMFEALRAEIHTRDMNEQSDSAFFSEDPALESQDFTTRL